MGSERMKSGPKICRKVLESFANIVRLPDTTSQPTNDEIHFQQPLRTLSFAHEVIVSGVKIGQLVEPSEVVESVTV